MEKGGARLRRAVHGLQLVGVQCSELPSRLRGFVRNFGLVLYLARRHKEEGAGEGRGLDFCAKDGRFAGIMTLTELETEVLPTLTLSERLRLIRRLATDVEAEAGNEDEIDEAEEARWDEELREDWKNHGPMWKRAQEARAAHARGETEEWP